MLRINIGRLALMPDATADDALDFADFVADMLPRADIVVVLNGREHEITSDDPAEQGRARQLVSTYSALWTAGAQRMADERPTIPSPPPDGCS